ncbi:hypothetical protein DPMN_127061 [Dreissena polymorpha]|uniref:Uncharacterized protein n=1 Tax=Dreissena polymorpha TaxID=45954 RepID=A0A9D4GY95_DREPO|nr:hypothetical protein DPMN_127061 [Dreissena polymorpha]
MYAMGTNKISYRCTRCLYDDDKSQYAYYRNITKEIRLLGLLPITGKAWTGGSAVKLPVKLALEDIRANGSILPGYNITYDFIDSQGLYRDEPGLQRESIKMLNTSGMNRESPARTGKDRRGNGNKRDGIVAPPRPMHTSS